MYDINQTIYKILEWCLGISLFILGFLLVYAGEIQLGLPYLLFGLVIVPVFPLPPWVRVFAAILGLILGAFD